ncbi:hypothetical protein [Microvirga soli]|uniref:hypothetical protein n=1 Tax=Microvirga soli TaxID=1854496 RepID=UPI00191DAE50|nr:hypothetical protein [Microvirga soli]
MTHMDDQLAKHIKAMIQKIRHKPTEDHEGGSEPDALKRLVRILRRSPEWSYDPVSLTRVPRRDAGS